MKCCFKDYFIIAIGTFLIAMAVSVFLVPSRLSSGGVSSIGTVLLYLFQIPISVTNLVANAVLFVFGYRLLGRESVLKAVVGILLFSLFLELTSIFPDYLEDRLVGALGGGLLIGIGVGLVVRVGGSTGGSDFAGILLHHLFPHVSPAILILLIDCAVVVISGIVFRSLTITLYSGITLSVAAKVMDFILSLGDAAKSVSVFSEFCDEIATKVMQRFGRGTTGILCKGMYSGKNRMMLLCVVSPKELPKLIDLIRSVDASAFVVINDSREVLGEGFKNDPMYHKS